VFQPSVSNSRKTYNIISASPPRCPDMSNKRPRSPSPSHAAANEPSIFISDAIVDRTSTFIGHFSPTSPAKVLIKLPELEEASHRIVAWRFPSPQRTIGPMSKVLYETGHDDDGEKNGGRTLEKLLDSMQVTGSVVVARWYGGVMLGPVRFTHMETCARNAIKAWRDEEGNKRRKIEDEKRKKELDEEDILRLPGVLAERDRSIAVLRGLLNQKTKKATEVAATASPSKVMDYSSMPLEAMRRLEGARDKSIAFLLKNIDAEEAKAKKIVDEERARKWLEAGSTTTAHSREEQEVTHKDRDASDVPEMVVP